jgi:hypothetical protein
MSLKSVKDVWDYLKKIYGGDERIRGMQSLNLIREFELQRMRDSETIKEYLERLLGIVNRVQFCWEPHSETLELLKRFRFQY